MAVLLWLLTLWPIPLYNEPTLEGRTVSVTGTVRSINHRNSKLQILLKDAIVSDDVYSPVKQFNKAKRALGAVCYLEQEACEPLIGSKIMLRGKYYNLETATNPGQFDMARYYQVRGVDFQIVQCCILDFGNSYNPLAQCLYGLKKRMENGIDALFNEEYGSILKAMLLGDKDYLGEDIKKLFESCGCSHLLVISGTHIGIIGLALYESLKRILKSWRISAFVSMLIIVLYGAMTGMGAATIRAVIMFIIAIAGDVLHRSYDLPTALSVAGVAELIFNPVLIYDSGFLLSFGAVMGIAVVMPVFSGALGIVQKGIIRNLLSGVLICLSVSIFTLPITLSIFYRYPVYSLMINFLLAALVGPLLISGIICALLCLVSMPAAFFVSRLTLLLLKVIIYLCIKVSSLPHGYIITGKPGMVKVIVFYGVLFLAVSFNSFWKKSYGVILGRIMLIPIISLMFLNPPAKTEITMLDVGQGDSILMRSDRHCVLNDGGSSSVKNVGKYRILPALLYKGISQVDMIIVSHMDADHVNGILELIDIADGEGISIRSLALSGNSAGTDEGAQLCEMAAIKGIRVYKIGKGDGFRIGRFGFECMGPEKEAMGESNELSVVLKVHTENMNMLLTGDVEGIGEKNLIEAMSDEKVYIYKAAHHGSRGTNSKQLLDKLKPGIALISCGENNSYGHPHRETIERLKAAGSRIFITRDTGAITISERNRKIIVGGFK